MLPLAALSLAFVQPARWQAKLAVGVLLAASLCLSLACALAGMFAEQTLFDPLVDWVLPRLMEPDRAWRAIFVVVAWAVLAVLLFRRPDRAMAARDTGRTRHPEVGMLGGSNRESPDRLAGATRPE
jgi:hypothetical protein